MTKFNNSNSDKNSITQIVTNLENSNSNQKNNFNFIEKITQKKNHQKSQNVIKIKNSKLGKLKNSKYDTTQKLQM